ncbi:MAG TPA: hypothetical protein VLS93_00890, partial [Anaeromyxobacteraceae bacterium]|nr:hypothetical protein [Anaeromyxobacteraceae bacterium]
MGARQLAPPRHLDLHGDEGDGWRPWASVPRQHSFFVAFDLDPAGELVEFALRVQFSGGSLTRLRGGDEGAPGRAAHAFSLDQHVRAVVREEENAARDEAVRVAFSRPCRRGGRVLAWLRLTSVLDAGGFLGMELLERSTTGRDSATLRAAGLSECPRQPPTAMPQGIAALQAPPSGEGDRPTLRRATVGGRPALVLERAPSAGTTAAEAAAAAEKRVVLGGSEVSAAGGDGERLRLAPVAQARPADGAARQATAAWRALGIAA